MKTVLIKILIGLTVLFLFQTAATAQEDDSLLRNMEAKAKQTAVELIAKINGSWSSDGTRYIEITTFEYKGFHVPLSQVWARLLQDKMIEEGGSGLRVLSADSRNQMTPSYRIKGEILDLGSTITIHTDLISYKDMSIESSVRAEFPKTPEISNLLLGDIDSAAGAVTPDSLEPDSADSPVQISAGSESLRRSLTAGDEDWFLVSLGDAQALRLYTTGDVDTYMAAYTYEDGIPGDLVTENDDIGENTNSSVTVNASYGSRFLVEVYGYDGATGVYGFSIEETEPLTDDYEPDNNAEQATELELDQGEIVSAFVTAEDADWYSFAVPEGLTAFIAAFTAGERDTEITLYDTDFNEIGYNDDGVEDYNAKIVTRLDPGTYYIMVKEINGDIGQYELTLMTEDITLDQYEPDNSILKPREINRGETQVHNFAPGNDKDYVRFTLESKEEIVFYTLGSIDTYLRLFDGNGELLIEDDDSGSEYNAMITASLDEGTYYIEVSPVSDSPSSEEYRLLFR